LPALYARLAGALSLGRKATAMKTFTSILIAAAALAALPAAAPAAVREFEGTVVSVNRDARTFRLHDSERGTKRIKVNSNTRYERIAGFAGLRKGMTRIEATVQRRNGRWVAIEVERSGGGGRHGGDDGPDDD
jgi:hypothetical protein